MIKDYVEDYHSAGHTRLIALLRNLFLAVVVTGFSTAPKSHAATITWTGTAGNGSWHTPGNWNLNRVPGTGDDVVINDLPATSFVTYSSSATTVNSLACAEPLNLNGGALTLATASSVSSPMTLAGATLGGAGDLQISGGLTWDHGTMTGSGQTSIGSGINWTIGRPPPGGSSVNLNRPLHNDGNCVRSGSSPVLINSTFHNRSGGTFSLQGGGGLSGTGTFDNQVGAVLSRTGGQADISCGLTNNGTVSVPSGTLQIFGPFTNWSGTTLTGGTFDVVGTLRFMNADIRTLAATIILNDASASIQNTSSANALANLSAIASGGSLTLMNGRALNTAQPLTNAGSVVIGPGSSSSLTANAGYTQTAGLTRLDSGSLVSSSVITIQAGTLSGSGTIAGNIFNDGTLSPGASPGTLIITGNYTQTAGGQLVMEIGGLTSGTQYDAITVSGIATLNGTLMVSLINGFLPVAPDSMTILSATSVGGTFSSDNLPISNGANCLDLLYRPADVRLKTFTSGTLTGIGVAIPSSVVAGQSVVCEVTVTPGTCPSSSGVTVTGNVSALSPDSQPAHFYDDGLNYGDRIASDNIYTYSLVVDQSTPPGLQLIPVTIADAQSRSSNIAISVTITAAPPVTGGQVDNLWITNGTVNKTLKVGSTLYVGGSFTHVGPCTGSGVPVSRATGMPAAHFPRIDGRVFEAISDGAGGWFIGGDFTQVGVSPRTNLAHILADGTVSSWNPSATGVSFAAVNALVLDGSTLFVGGRFSSIGGQPRQNLAALDTATGLATSWSADVLGTTSAYVSEILLNGPTLYAGGSFSSVGGQPRSGLAAVAAATGAVLSFNPGSDHTVHALAWDGAVLYAGGIFSNIGGQSRRCLAALDPVSGLATSWDPNPTGPFPYVHTLAVAGSAVFAGGLFTGIGGGEGRFSALLTQ